MTSATPIFAVTPKLAIAQVTTANTALDGTGTPVTIYTAGASGSRIDRIDIKAQVTTTAGMVRLFVHDGANARIWKEILVAAITKSATVAAFTATVDLSQNPLVLPTGYSLRATTEKTETFNIHANGGDF